MKLNIPRNGPNAKKQIKAEAAQLAADIQRAELKTEVEPIVLKPEEKIVPMAPVVPVAPIVPAAPIQTQPEEMANTVPSPEPEE